MPVRTRAGPRINPNPRVLEYVPIPLRVRALHRQEVELLVFQHEPDRDRDCPTRLPADHAELDLSVAGEAVFEVVIGDHESMTGGKLALCARA